jgi:hypothetical protein
MALSEVLEQVQFVVGPDGHPTAALIDITTGRLVQSCSTRCTTCYHSEQNRKSQQAIS